MKQRVAVARTLANAPEVMLMDEPFAAVDAQTRMTLQEELLRSGRGDVTVAFVTHSVEEAVFLGDRVVVLGGRPGRVVRGSTCRSRASGEAGRRLGGDAEFAALRDRVLQLVAGRRPGRPDGGELAQPARRGDGAS